MKVVVALSQRATGLIPTGGRLPAQAPELLQIPCATPYSAVHGHACESERQLCMLRHQCQAIITPLVCTGAWRAGAHVMLGLMAAMAGWSHRVMLHW
jgi:hypothetical protein